MHMSSSDVYGGLRYMYIMFWDIYNMVVLLGFDSLACSATTELLMYAQGKTENKDSNERWHQY